MEQLDELMRQGLDGIFLDGPVTFPGCCYCDTCKELFLQKHGKEMPTEENWRDDNWRNFIEFREESLARFLADARKVVESVNPEGVVALNAGNIDASSWRVARDNTVCAPHQHFNIAECFYHPGRPDFSLHGWSLLSKYLGAETPTPVAASHHALGAWHYNPLPECESRISIAQTIANGGNPWFAVFIPAVDADKERAMAPVEEMNGFMEQHEEYYVATKSAANIAILLSRQTYNFYVSDLERLYGAVGSGVEVGLGVDMGDGKGLAPEEWAKRKRVCEEMLDLELKGYCDVLMREHIPFDIILDHDLTNGKVDGYETLILPGCACLTSEQKNAIVRYVESGGKCVGSFELGRFDEHGNPLGDMSLLNFFGVNEIEDAWPTQAFEEYLKIKTDAFAEYFTLKNGALVPRPVHALKVKAGPCGNPPAVFMNTIGAVYTAPKGESQYPGVILKDSGKGKTVYFPHMLGHAISRYKVREHKDLFTALLLNVLEHKRLVITNAPPTVEVEIRTQPEHDRVLVHVVNMTGDMQRPINHIVKLHGLEFSIAVEGASRVHLLGEGELPFERTERGIKFTVPELDVYQVVVIEEANSVKG